MILSRSSLAILACASAAAIALPIVVAHMRWFQSPELDLRPGVSRDRVWLLVIGRRPERSFEAQTDVPFRNSPMALYEQCGDMWVKREGDLMTRSTSSSTSRPLDSDIPTVVKCLEAEDAYGYGYTSVPCGAYWLSPAKPESPDTRWLISDWGTLDGVVAMDRAETVRFCQVDRFTSGPARLVDLSETSRRTEKRKTYLHGTVTRHWSHVDSRGCINLCVEPESAGPEASPWDDFVGWVRTHGLLSRPVGLVIVCCDELTSEPAVPLPPRLAVRIVPSFTRGGCTAHVSPHAL